MDEFLKHFNQEFQSSSGKTEQWKEFYRVVKKSFKKGLSPFAEDIKFCEGHFYFSGFFTVKDTDRIYYFSVSDVRWSDGLMMIRTAKSYTDYSGGVNQWVPVNQKMFDEVRNLVKGM